MWERTKGISNDFQIHGQGILTLVTSSAQAEHIIGGRHHLPVQESKVLTKNEWG